MTSSKIRKSLLGIVFIAGLTAIGGSEAYALGGLPFFQHGCGSGCCDSRAGRSHSRCGDDCCRNKHSFGRLFGWLKHDRGCGCQSECHSGCGGFFRQHRNHGRGCNQCGSRYDRHAGGGGCAQHGPVGAYHGGHPYHPAMPAPQPRRLAVRPRHRVVPPPGTLGWTYRKPSCPVPVHEHPRTGMLTICNLPAVCSVSVDGMTGYRGIDGAWHFKTIQPLVPGVPHIVTVRARVMQAGLLVDDMRVVRLIRGRIVDLEY